MKRKTWNPKVVSLGVICLAVLMIPRFITGTLTLQYIINIMIFAYFAT